MSLIIEAWRLTQREQTQQATPAQPVQATTPPKETESALTARTPLGLSVLHFHSSDCAALPATALLRCEAVDL